MDENEKNVCYFKKKNMKAKAVFIGNYASVDVPSNKLFTGSYGFGAAKKRRPSSVNVLILDQ